MDDINTYLELDKRIEVIEKKIASLLKKNASLTKELAEVKINSEVRESEIYNFNQKIKSDIMNLKQLLDENNEDDSLYLILNSIQGDCDELAIKINSFDKEYLIASEKSIVDLNSKIDNLNKLIEDKTIQINTKVNRLEDDIIALLYEAEKHEVKGNLKSENNGISKEIKNLKEEFKNLKSDIEEDIDFLEDEIYKVKDEIDSCKNLMYKDSDDIAIAITLEDKEELSPDVDCDCKLLEHIHISNYKDLEKYKKYLNLYDVVEEEMIMFNEKNKFFDYKTLLIRVVKYLNEKYKSEFEEFLKTDRNTFLFLEKPTFNKEDCVLEMLSDWYEGSINNIYMFIPNDEISILEDIMFLLKELDLENQLKIKLKLKEDYELNTISSESKGQNENIKSSTINTESECADVIENTLLVNPNTPLPTKKQKQALIKLTKKCNCPLKVDIDTLSKKEVGVLLGYLKGTAKKIDLSKIENYLEINRTTDISNESNITISNYSLKIDLATKISGEYIPVGVQILEHTIEVDSWTNLLFEIAKYLYEYNKDSFKHKVLFSPGNINTYFSSNSFVIENAKEVSDSGVYLSMDIYFQGVIFELIKELIKLFDIDEKNVFIYLKNKKR